MSEKITFDNLADFFIPEKTEQNLRGGGSEEKAFYRNHSKKIALTIGYMLGVKPEYLEKIPDFPEEYAVLEQMLSKNDDLNAIRYLNNIRTSIMLSFTEISRKMRDLTPIDQIDRLKEDFSSLRKIDIIIYTGRNDLYEYIRLINKEIGKRIDKARPYFPNWVNFSHIRTAFVCPPNLNYEEEGIRFSHNRDFYPYRKYFYWKFAEELGNILLSDEKVLRVLYENGGEEFRERERVVDVSDAVKENIHIFFNKGSRIQAYIDGENVDPYRFSSMINGLTEEEIRKIDKIIVYYDVKYSTKAWMILRRFVRGVEVELIGVERIYEEKSLVDHKLVAGVSKAVYKDGVDSVMLCSSDSDFWTVIENVEANYIVMVESDKCGKEFKDILKEHDVFYCYTDKFIQKEEDYYLETVLNMETKSILDERINALGINLRDILAEALRNSYAQIPPQRKENLYNEYVKNLRVVIDDDGTISLTMEKP